MSVDVVFSGRLGNNLFQYVLGRIIAEHYGLEMNCSTLYQEQLTFGGKALDVGPYASLPSLSQYFPNAPLYIPGLRVRYPVEDYTVRQNSPWNGQKLDLQKLLKDPKPRHFRLAGFFQRFEYFEPHQARIRQWLAQVPPTLPWRVSDRDVVLNIRRGFDYWLLNWTLPMSYYRAALSRFRNIGTVYVCGTGIDDGVRAALVEYDPVYYEASPIEHFAFMRCFDRIVISNSTFAWWAAFLSNAHEIIGPRSTGGDPLGCSGSADIDLTLEEARYQELEITGRARLALPLSPEVASMREEDGTLVVCTPEGASRTIELGCGVPPWLPNIIRPGEPVQLAELRRLCPPHLLDQLIMELISHRVLGGTPLYFDE